MAYRTAGDARHASPSSRRAWIEMSMSPQRASRGIVALLAEGVDRNVYPVDCCSKVYTSPSSRRAWIEIPWIAHTPYMTAVALLAEGVDRNVKPIRSSPLAAGRPPRGGRG